MSTDRSVGTLCRLSHLVNSIDPFGPAARLSYRTRLLWLLCAVGLVALLVVAACLTPNPQGYGTHQQLGLPPCSFQWLSGMRCPGCGMTTSWSHAVRGELSDAVQANAGGLLLALLAASGAVVALAMAASGRRLQLVMNRGVGIAVAVTVFGVTLIDWLIRLGANYWPDSWIGQ